MEGGLCELTLLTLDLMWLKELTRKSPLNRDKMLLHATCPTVFLRRRNPPLSQMLKKGGDTCLFSRLRL